MEVPRELLTDGGPDFLSGVNKEVNEYFNVLKLNTCLCHPKRMGWWKDSVRH